MLEKDAYCYQEFIDRQSRKGTIGGKTSNSSFGGIAKSKKYEKLRLQAKSFYDEKLSKTDIAEKLGVSRRTITRWLEHD